MLTCFEINYLILFTIIVFGIHAVIPQILLINKINSDLTNLKLEQYHQRYSLNILKTIVICSIFGVTFFIMYMKIANKETTNVPYDQYSHEV